MIRYATIRYHIILLSAMEQLRIKGQISISELTGRLAPVLLRHGVVRTAVFGSVARGEATKTSDLDLSVEFEPGRKITLSSILDLQHDIEDLIGKKVHISMPENVKPFLREIINRELVYIL
jgi:uncharacterized protein